MENTFMSDYDFSQEDCLTLKVSADPADISSEERKKNMKRLAGAISHALRSDGEVHVRAFGQNATVKAAKALCVARENVKATGGVSGKLSLVYSPAFAKSVIGGKEFTGIGFYVFANEYQEDDEIDIDSFENPLKVSADPANISQDERKKRVKKLAAAISHSVEEHKECVVRAITRPPIVKGLKALAIARGLTATRGPDLYCWSKFIVAHNPELNIKKTGIAFYAYANE